MSSSTSSLTSALLAAPSPRRHLHHHSGASNGSDKPNFMASNGMDKPEKNMDSGERRLLELGYKQELRREMTLFKTLAISFSTMTLFTGITPLYGSSFAYAGPVGVVWGWIVVTFFTWFVGIAMAEICSSFPTTGSLYFWAAHLAGPKWGPFASWCCAWLETIGLIAGVGTQRMRKGVTWRATPQRLNFAP